MATASDLVIGVFETPAAARHGERALHVLSRRLRTVRLGGVGIVSRAANGRSQIRRKSQRPAWRGALIGLVVGAVLAALVAAPMAIVNEIHLLLTDNRLFLPTSGVLVLALVLGTLIALGITILSGLVGAALGVIVSVVGRFGVGRHELRQIAAWLQPGEQALLLRVRPTEVDPVRATLARGGARIYALEANQSGQPAAPPVPIAVTAAVDPLAEDLVVATFPGPGQAVDARMALQRLDRRDRAIALGNIAIVERQANGAVRFQQREEVTAGGGALFGASLGCVGLGLGLGVVGAFGGGSVALALIDRELLSAGDVEAVLYVFIALFAGIFAVAGAILGAIGGALIGLTIASTTNFGLRADELRELGEQLPAGAAALAALVHPYEIDRVVAGLRPYTDDVVHNGVSEIVPASGRSLAASLTDRGRLAAIAIPGSRRLVTTRSGVRIYCVEHHVGDDYVVFLHGAGGDHLAWVPQLPALHAAGYSTLMLDLRGHGYSDRPADADAYLLEDFAADVDDVLDALGLTSFILVGHCFGGMVATMFHQAHPDRSKGYMLLDTAAKAPAPLAAVARRAPFALGAFNRVIGLAPNYRQRLFHADMEKFKGSSDRQTSRLLSDIQHTRLSTWINVFAEGVGRFDGVAALASMTQPVWVIVGADDTVFTVADATIIHDTVAGSRLITVAGANHIIVVNNPEVVEQLILDFIHDNQVFGPRPAATASVAVAPPTPGQATAVEPADSPEVLSSAAPIAPTTPETDTGG